MCRLSVFAGGWSLEAAEALWPDDATFEGVATLVDHSLIYTKPAEDETARFGMLDTIRTFAAEQLEAADVRARHAAYYLEMAEQAETHLRGDEQGRWLARLEAEHDNLRAALTWALGGEDRPRPAATEPARERSDLTERSEVGMRLGGALWRFWWGRGYLREGRRWLDELLAADPTPNLARVKALRGAGVLATAHDDHERATTLLGEGLALARALGDAGAVATLLINLGNESERQGRYADALALYEESESLAREAGDDSTAMWALGNQGIVAMWTGDFVRAAALFEQCLTAARAAEDAWSMATALLNLGIVSAYLGDYARAQAEMNESLSLARLLGAHAHR